MKPPDANLPSLSQPWGRWVSSALASAKETIRRFFETGSSMHISGMSAAANIASRANKIVVRRTDVFDIATYTRNFAAVPFGTTIRTIADSPTIFINAPVAGKATIVANCESSTENVATVIIRVNGVDAGNGSDFRYSSSIRTAYGNCVASATTEVDLLGGSNSIQIGVESGVALPIPTSVTISNMTVAVSYRES